MKPNFMDEQYDKYVTHEIREQVENKSLEECGIIVINEEEI